MNTKKPVVELLGQRNLFSFSNIPMNLIEAKPPFFLKPNTHFWLILDRDTESGNFSVKMDISFTFKNEDPIFLDFTEHFIEAGLLLSMMSKNVRNLVSLEDIFQWKDLNEEREKIATHLIAPIVKVGIDFVDNLGDTFPPEKGEDPPVAISIDIDGWKSEIEVPFRTIECFFEMKYKNLNDTAIDDLKNMEYP